MRAYAARTAKRSATQTITQGAGFVQVLDLPSVDNLNKPELILQRGHLLLFLDRITQSSRDGTNTIRGKIGSNNDSTLTEPPSEGGAIIPIYGGFRLDVAPFLMPAATTATFQAFYAAGELSPGRPHWNTAKAITLASNGVQNQPGPWIEIGTPPMGTTEYRAIVPNVSSDDDAPAPLELQWLNADATVGAVDFLTFSRGIGLAPQGFHARIRTSAGYGASGETPRVLWTWS